MSGLVVIVRWKYVVRVSLIVLFLFFVFIRGWIDLDISIDKKRIKRDVVKMINDVKEQIISSHNKENY